MTEAEIAENLIDAGLDGEEISSVLACVRSGDIGKAEKLIAACRRKQLDFIHEKERNINRLDYLHFRLRNGALE